MRLLHGEGGHYSLVEIQSFKEIEGLEADSLNWIFTGTSGVHGTSETAEDYLDPSQYTWIGDNTVKDVNGEEYQPTITVLVIHPRLVCTRYGDIKVSKKDIEWLRKQEIATLKAIESKLAIKQAGSGQEEV